MDSLIYLDGHLYPKDQALLPVTEEGLLYGLGLFETIRVEEGIPLFLEEHLERLFQGAKRIDLPPPKEDLMTAIFQLIKANQLQLGRLRLNLIPHHLFIIPYHGLPYQQKDYGKGFQAIILKERRLHSSLLPSIKSFSFLENVLGRRRAHSQGVKEGLFLNEKGFLCEGSISNLFLFFKGVWMTPHLNCGLLPGITRELVLRIFQEKDIPYEEREDLTPQHLYQGEEAFLTNSLLELMPLIQCDGQMMGRGIPGPHTKRLIKEYTTMKEGRIHDFAH